MFATEIVHISVVTGPIGEVLLEGIAKFLTNLQENFCENEHA